VRDVMTRDVVTVSGGTAAREAAALLAEHGFTALPVVDGDGALLGLVTEADLLRDRLPLDPRSLLHGAPPAGGATAPPLVAQALSAAAVVAAPGTEVAALAQRMLDEHARSVPVVDGGRLVGIVTRRDLLRAVCRDDETVAADIRYHLGTFGGIHRWHVTVSDGRAQIADSLDDADDRHVAEVLARAVPGVVDVRVEVVDRAAGHG
jgi:CBS domain-containing protein